MPRAKGTLNGQGKGLVPIKNWKPWMTKIVILHMAGMSREQISLQFPSKKNPSKYLTTARISQILSDPESQAIQRGMNAAVKKEMQEDLSSGMLVLAQKSMLRLAETIDSDYSDNFLKKTHQDRVALALVKNAVHGEMENKAAKQEISDEKVLNRFSAALEKVAEAQRLRSGPIIEAEVEILDKKVS